MISSSRLTGNRYCEKEIGKISATYVLCSSKEGEIRSKQEEDEKRKWRNRGLLGSNLE